MLSSEFEQTYSQRLLQKIPIIDLDPQLHQSSMTYLWCGVIDIGIIMAMYQYRRYAIIFHALAGITAFLFSFITTIRILLDYGWIQDQFYVSYHMIQGTVLYGVIFCQVGLGVASRVMSFRSGSSSVIIRKINLAHKYLGYFTLFICKVQCIFINFYPITSYLIYPIVETTIFIIILLTRKLYSPKLQNTIHPKYINYTNATPISNTKYLEQQGIKFVIFANYVYKLDAIKRDHPVGIQVIQSVSGRDIDRYVYGMYSSEMLVGLPLHSHSFKSLALLGQPIHKLQIRQLYHIFQSSNLQENSRQLIQCKVAFINTVSQKGQIYEIYVKPIIPSPKNQSNKSVYTELSQLGRYHSITINSKTTRLYTEALFITNKNRRFLQAYLDFGRVIPRMNKSKQVQIIEDAQKQDQLGFLMKKYDVGVFTKKFIEEKNVKNIVISQSKGAGLEFGNIYEKDKKGLIIMVAGGTGLYPFSDLIDLLYKAKFMKNSEDPKIEEIILGLSPILKIKPFQGFKFHLMASFNFFQDIHPITFAQLKYLTKTQNKEEESIFKVSIRIKDKQKINQIQNCNFEILQSRFENLLKEKIQRQDLRKVFICGPPPMNESMASLMMSQGPSFEDKYLIM